MPFADQMIAGLKLMLLGMGIVFTFLVILVFALRAMSLLAERLSGTDMDMAAVQSVKRFTPGSGDSELIAVLTAAVARFRNKKI